LTGQRRREGALSRGFTAGTRHHGQREQHKQAAEDQGISPARSIGSEGSPQHQGFPSRNEIHDGAITIPAPHKQPDEFGKSAAQRRSECQYFVNLTPLS
jgi:hypothetical protein